VGHIGSGALLATAERPAGLSGDQLAAESSRATPSGLRIRSEHWDLGERTRLMGVLNVTPDSFSDGGQFLDPSAAIDQGMKLAEAGADLIDVGGESTRPSGPMYGQGPREISVEAELARVLPVIEGLKRRISIPISVDTRKAGVAAAAVGAGAALVNDVSGGTFDRDLLPLCARLGVPVILMHMRGTPETMQAHTDYGDVCAEVAAELRLRLEAALAAGLSREQILLDPGLGFAKTTFQSLALLGELRPLLALGQGLVVGASRKSFLAGSPPRPPSDRVLESVAAAALAAFQGASILRVHDVPETLRVVRLVDAVRARELGREALLKGSAREAWQPSSGSPAA
jgi:dihydropteroate synthase